MNAKLTAATTALIAAAAVICGAAAPSGGATANASPTLQQDVDALVRSGAPGVVLRIENGDQVVNLTAGVTDLRSGRPMNATERFRVASVTKTYTATVLLQLVGEGKLHLDDTVEQWLPGVVPAGDGIKIRQLLNHTSGLADFEYDPKILAPYLAGDLSHAWSPRQLVRIAVAHKPLFAPGKGESYSSTNYVLAGLIIEARTGNSLASELNRRIFKPLQLSRTSFPTTSHINGPHAHGYLVIKTPPATDVTDLYPFPWAAGAVLSNAADTATFYQALLSGKLLRPAELKSMKQTHAQAHVDIPGQRYGLGIARYPLPCGTAWGHNGSFPGYYVYNFTSSDGQRQAVLEVNADPSSVSKTTLLKSVQLLEKAYCS